MIEIWQPRYHDNKVLIATYKVKSGQNLIVFTKAKYLQGKIFSCNGSIIKSCPIETNGKISCYAVPMEKLELESEEQV